MVLRKPVPFYDYLYDWILKDAGLLSKAKEQIVALLNGMTASKEIGSYNKFLLRLIGMGLPPQRQDEAQIMLQAHVFFDISKASSNLSNGGLMSIFDLMDRLRVAIEDPKACAHILRSMRPNCLNARLSFEKAIALQIETLAN